MQHITVLLEEAVDELALTPESIVVDATFGAGGHAHAIVKRLGTAGTYVGIDADASAFKDHTFKEAKATVHLVNDNFKNITEILRSLHITKVDGILADLGWRMEQFAEGNKGFSFNVDEPLLMTFGEPSAYPFTATDIVNEWDEEVLANIFYGYAEETAARKISRAIIEARKKEKIDTTFKLRDVVMASVPKAALHRGIHPATKVFQALRIAVNDELGVLERFLGKGFEALNPGGRMAIITFHSIEDRVVKHFFRELVQAERGELFTKKPIAPTREEVVANSRARSAKLRIITKTE